LDPGSIVAHNKPATLLHARKQKLFPNCSQAKAMDKQCFLAALINHVYGFTFSELSHASGKFDPAFVASS
jgi:hypothetical protein